MLSNDYPEIGFGAHFHTTPDTWREKVDAAWNAGCTRFDGAIKGIGGCPMAGDKLVGNMDTELMVPYFNETGLLENIDIAALKKCSRLASEIFV